MPADPKPYIPEGGARLQFRKRMYMLRAVDGERLLFNERGTRYAPEPTYRLEDVPLEPGRHYDVFSVRTGKRVSGQIVCFMRQGYPPAPRFPKVPLWKES